MKSNPGLLRMIPKVDDVLRLPVIAESEAPLPLLTDCVRQTLDALREEIRSGVISELPDDGALCARIFQRIQEETLPSLRPVINGTGVILHTNLGRACLSEKAAEAAARVASAYSTLEYDTVSGSRGLRYSHVEPLLQRLTGAESALVVNNNAAAVLLILSALGNGKEVVVSRGELVEIGGAFRVPEIMEQCGCQLKEVGTTNKTRLRDYEQAIGENTFALMKVHTSNFKIVGFSESVDLADLVELGRRYDLPLIHDLGSGALVRLEDFGILDEPGVMESVDAGVDIVSFSGDKLLGGPQTGIILGKKKYMDILKEHPLLRAMRVDKMTLAALEATLRAYLDVRTVRQEIPVLAMLTAGEDALREKAERLQTEIRTLGLATDILPVEGQVGGGSVPMQTLKSFAVAPQTSLHPDVLEARMRSFTIPVIGRIWHDRWLLDVRTLWEADFPQIAASLAEALP